MTFFKASVFLLILTCCCSALENRLSDKVIPTFYNVSLTIDPEEDDYSGTVEITFLAYGELSMVEINDSIIITTLPPSDEIYIHNDGDFIEVGSVLLNNEAECTSDSPNDTHISRLSCSTNPDADEENTLLIEFTGKFSKEDGYGLVKTSYNDGESDQVIIESNFKPIYARRAFPCMDEPDLIAGFSLEIIHPAEYTVLSNSPTEYSVEYTTDDEMQVTRFEEIPEISPHLLSIFISKFKETDTDPEDDVDFKIFARKEVSASTTALANTYYHQIIEKLDEFTGISYADLGDTESYFVAVPDYSDAMGGFGLFAYKETDLFDEGEKTTNLVRQNIISNMAYKLSQQWYGGNVATKWWSDVWANEAVATYLKYIISDEVDEELELTNQFLLEVNQKMLRYDGYQFAQPLSSKGTEINSEWIIENKLSSINYEKGASILHMINLILGGKEFFQTALQNHWQSRNDTNGKDILNDLLSLEGNYYTYFEKWAFSSGFPLITVTLNDAGYTDSITLAQKRFLYPTGKDVIDDDEIGWYVPVSVGSKENLSTVHVSIFMTPDKSLSFYFDHDAWIVVNSQGGCFYRVNYDEILWNRILSGLKANREDFQVLQRAQLLDDVFNIARTGDVNYSLAFQMADLLIDETEYYPWYSAMNVFSYLLGKMGNEDDELSLKKYILGLMENALVIPKNNFIEDDKHVDVLKKVMLLNWACYLGHEGCITYATEKFASYKESQTSMEDYNARGVIFCNAIRYSDNVKDDWDFLWKVYGTSTSVHEQNDILNGLGCVVEKSILESYLQKIITEDSGIKRQDVLLVFNSVLSSSLGLEVATEFLEENFLNIQNFFKNMRILCEMVHALAEKLMSDDHVDWLSNLLKDETLDDYEDIRTKANALATVNNYWQNNFQEDVANIIHSYISTTSTTNPTPTTNPLPTTKPAPTTNPTPTSNPSPTTKPLPTTNPSPITTPTALSTPDDSTITDMPLTTPSKSITVSLSEYVLLLLVIFTTII